MITARVTVAAAYDVANYLENELANNAELGGDLRPGWEAVRDALYALANDTDAIVTEE